MRTKVLRAALAVASCRPHADCIGRDVHCAIRVGILPPIDASDGGRGMPATIAHVMRVLVHAKLTCSCRGFRQGSSQGPYDRDDSA